MRQDGLGRAGSAVASLSFLATPPSSNQPGSPLIGALYFIMVKYT